MLAIRKRGKFYHARGTVPMRQADGSIARVRIEESTYETSRVRALRAAQTLADYYHEQAYRPKSPTITFSDAALTYVKTRGKPDRFLPKLVGYFAETPISEINQTLAVAAAHRLYPGASAATHVRAVFAPLTTVLRLSGVRPDFKLPRIERKLPRVPPEEWFDTVLPRCDNQLAALLIFITLTGRRITEALQAIDNGDGTATIGRAKNGKPVTIFVPDFCRDLLGPGAAGLRLFSYGDRHNVYRALRPVCKRAGVPYYGTHSLGRHAFTTRLLKEGWSVKHVAVAGGWATPRMVLERYGHVEHSEVQEDVRRVGQEWGKRREKGRK
jgi:integrase